MGAVEQKGSWVTLLDPMNAPTVTGQIKSAQRLADLTGKRVALVNNTKAGTDQILEGLFRHLTRQYGVTKVEFYHDSPSKPIDPDMIRDVASAADFAITGVGD